MKIAIVCTALTALMAGVSAVYLPTHGKIHLTVSATQLASKDRARIGFLKLKTSESDPFYRLYKCLDQNCSPARRVEIMRVSQRVPHLGDY